MKKSFAVISLFLMMFTSCPGYASHPLQSDISHYQRYNMTDEQRDSALKTLELEEKREEKRREGRDIRWTSKTEQEFDAEQTTSKTLKELYTTDTIIALIINAIIYLLPFYIFRRIHRQPSNKWLSFLAVCLYGMLANFILCYIIYGFYLPGSYPPWLWLIFAYYYLVAQKPILAPANENRTTNKAQSSEHKGVFSMIGSTKREKIMNLIENAIDTNMPTFYSYMKNIVANSANLSDEETQILVRQARKIYCDEITKSICLFLKSNTEFKNYSLLESSISNPQSCGIYDYDVNKGLSAGKLYQICFSVWTGRSPLAKDASYLDHYQNKRMQEVIDTLSNE